MCSQDERGKPGKMDSWTGDSIWVRRRPRAVKRAYFLFEERVRMRRDARKERRDVPYRLCLRPIQNLSSNEGPGYDQVFPSCKSLIHLWADEIIRDLYRRRPACDESRQRYASEEFLLSTCRVSSKNLKHVLHVQSKVLSETHGGRSLRGRRRGTFRG